MNRIKILLAMSIFAVISNAAESPRGKYERVFSEYTLRVLTPRFEIHFKNRGQSRDEAKRSAETFVRESIKCHMKSMDLQDPGVSGAAYQSIESGGSYPDAKMAFEMALSDAIEQENALVVERLNAATKEAMSCVKLVKKSLGV